MSRIAPCASCVPCAPGSLLAAAWLVLATGAAAGSALARGDAAWARRAEGEESGRPQPGPILEAVSAYEEALASKPEDLEAHWKLLRAFYFAGYFAAERKEAS